MSRVFCDLHTAWKSEILGKNWSFLVIFGQKMTIFSWKSRFLRSTGEKITFWPYFDAKKIFPGFLTYFWTIIKNKKFCPRSGPLCTTLPPQSRCTRQGTIDIAAGANTPLAKLNYIFKINSLASNELPNSNKEKRCSLDALKKWVKENNLKIRNRVADRARTREVLGWCENALQLSWLIN